MMFLQSIPSVKRKRRSLVIKITLWLLKKTYDTEKGEMYRYSDKLDQLDLYENVSHHEYTAIEEEYLHCECALGHIDCAIEDLEFAYYEGRM
jgi:hypothetical protein